MTKYMITSRYQNVIQNQNIVIRNLSFENVEKFRYLAVTVTNTNAFAKKLNAEYTWEVHVVIHLRKFYHPICFPRNCKLIHITNSKVVKLDLLI